jgi:hypothetical protein
LEASHAAADDNSKGGPPPAGDSLDLTRESVMLEIGVERGVIQLAAGRRMAVYGASYAALAARHGFMPATDDGAPHRNERDVGSTLNPVLGGWA